MAAIIATSSSVFTTSHEQEINKIDDTIVLAREALFEGAEKAFIAYAQPMLAKLAMLLEKAPTYAASGVQCELGKCKKSMDKCIEKGVAKADVVGFNALAAASSDRYKEFTALAEAKLSCVSRIKVRLWP